MSIKNKRNLQKLLDGLPYPPTHTYKLEGLVPTGVLKERMDIITRIAPCFFHGERFLDVGCNKGFFSLLASLGCDEVVGIDSDKIFVELCEMLKSKNMTVIHSTFRDFSPAQYFDRIFIGNTHHYIFKECQGWQWVYKLAAISNGEVIIEGPIDMKCRDMKNVLPEEIQHLFSFGAFMEIMRQFFDLIKIIPTAKYTPGRFVMYFKRKYDPFIKNSLQLNTLPSIRVLKEDENNMVFITKLKPQGGNIVAKVIKHPSRDLKIRISIARYSPISNGAIGSIYDRGKFVGWLEEYNPHGTYAYKENERKLFLKMCEHVIFLAKIGYFDGDCATINFFRDNDLYFDKSAVFPISEINEEVYENFRGYGRGYYFIHLTNSFSIITPEIEKIIYQALKSKDPIKIERAFNQIKNLLSTNKNLIEKEEKNSRDFLSYFLKRIIHGIKSRYLHLLHPIVFEDFYPLDSTLALVACGKNYTRLSDIKLVKYKLHNKRVIIIKYLRVIQKGSYLRLGNFFEGKLVYSNKNNIYLKTDKEIVKVGEGIQPFMSELGMLYQRQGIVFLNSRPLIKPWDDYVVVERPTLFDKWVFFETRKGPAPEAWEIWRFEISSGKKELILRHGANSYVFNDKLFYSRWLREKQMFETYWLPAPH